MTHAIRVLQAEHKKLATLLQVMDNLHCEMVAGRSPDFPLLHEIGDYLQGYPDQVHHPKEDLIYRRLRKREPSPDDGPGNLVHEHEDLSNLTAGFVRILDETEKNPETWAEEFQGEMRKLIDYYKHHMEMEEKFFFPAAKQRLTKNDWAEVTYAISEQVDPLFDEATAKFERLREEIIKHADMHQDRDLQDSRAKAQSDDMLALATAEHFNLRFESQYPNVRLIVDNSGTYSLVDTGRTVLIIPESDEKTAVWCAFCFLMGKKR